MLVGPSGGGKTTTYQLLASALTHLAEGGSQNSAHGVVKTYTLNPKAITIGWGGVGVSGYLARDCTFQIFFLRFTLNNLDSGELFGEFNEHTHEWTDGLAAALVRQAVADTTNTFKVCVTGLIEHG